jgi:hypothetical protein
MYYKKYEKSIMVEEIIGGTYGSVREHASPIGVSRLSSSSRPRRGRSTHVATQSMAGAPVLYTSIREARFVKQSRE